MGCVTGFGGLFLIAFVLLFTTHYSLMNTRKVKNIAELQDQLEKIKNEKNIEDTELENIKKENNEKDEDINRLTNALATLTRKNKTV